jgi:RNA polymerase sigma-70 factor (ECF subfamily)
MSEAVTEDLQRDLERLHDASFAWAMVCAGYRREEAEDVLQTTYLKILDGRARFKGASSLKTWLFAVIRNTAAEERRRRWLRRILLARLHDAPEPVAPASPHANLSAHERRERIRAVLLTISPRQRQVAELVFFHDLSVEEAAHVMGVSVGSARVHYDRAKQLLGPRLERLGDLG